MNHKLTLEQVTEILKGNKEIATWYKAMVKVFPKYKITTAERIAGFIAQCAHESNNFTVLEENLYYKAETLDRVFPKYFKNAGRNAAEYAKNPEKIANVVYAGRMGNNNPGDGYRFRGRGVIQLTGRDNYTAFGKTLNKTAEQVVDYVTTIEGALESACWYWNSRNINAAADAGDIVKMTKLINGGTIGLDDRKKHYEHALAVLTGKPVAHTAAPVAARSSAASRVVKLGSRGATVKAVQAALGLTADGAFGPATEAAVKQWQSANGLVADGIVGPATLAKLVS